MNRLIRHLTTSTSVLGLSALAAVAAALLSGQLTDHQSIPWAVLSMLLVVFPQRVGEIRAAEQVFDIVTGAIAAYQAAHPPALVPVLPMPAPAPISLNVTTVNEAVPAPLSAPAPAP